MLKKVSGKEVLSYDLVYLDWDFVVSFPVGHVVRP